MLVRRGKFKPSKGGPTYLPRDNVRLKVIMFLRSVNRSNQHNMTQDERSGLRGQKWVSLANILDELCEWGWITKKPSEDAKNVTVYELLDKGRELSNKLAELQSQNNELWKLDSFHEVKVSD
ncbi:hypothetical protein NSIN_20283 [Nitrosotalea sinensis]|uniref:Uncharacterized protein n=1 Tax=Nitrosotalea sinensis TaxID=1499975 RepID=A0A2H1EFG4_9ARCH|nr:hypothetical protein [Candidatus Nitrosotalea sinensis]SHO44266.1 hypothetical protein NSIN_20283 [Candidatus Nitrosotalea sinensis]